MIPTFRPWTHTSDDSYMYQLSLVVATATVSFLFERSEFLIDTYKKKVCACARVPACRVHVCNNIGFSVGSANRLRPKHGIPLPV